MSLIGIYCIINKVNSKRYIGSSRCLTKRIKRHFQLLKSNSHWNIKLQNAVNKVGIENFDYEILEILETGEDLIFRENYWIAIHQSLVNGYNLNWAGEWSPVKSPGRKKGFTLSKETKDKIRLSSLLRWWPRKIALRLYNES